MLQFQSATFLISFVLAFAFMPFAVLAQTEILPKTYQEAKFIVDKQDLDFEAKEFVNKLFLPYFKKKYSGVLRNCFSNLDYPNDEPISMIVILNYDGTVAKEFSNKETNIHQCLSQEIKQDQFPAPFFAPFYVRIDFKVL